MAVTQQNLVVQVGASSLRPRDEVMCGGPPGGAIAAGPLAATVACIQRPAARAGHDPRRAPDVDDGRLALEEDSGDAALAGPPLDRGGRDDRPDLRLPAGGAGRADQGLQRRRDLQAHRLLDADQLDERVRHPLVTIAGVVGAMPARERLERRAKGGAAGWIEIAVDAQDSVRPGAQLQPPLFHDLGLLAREARRVLGVPVVVADVMKPPWSAGLRLVDELGLIEVLLHRLSGPGENDEVAEPKLPLEHGLG
jgi:hypothetical protein